MSSEGTGSFVLERSPEGADLRESVLWFTHPSFFAKAVRLPPDPSAWGVTREYALEPNGGFVVRVETEDGAAVAGASVEQIGRWPLPDQPTDTWESRAYLVFHRTATTGPDGTALISSAHGKQALRATHDGLASAPWNGAGRDASRATLVLRSVFRVSGVVHSGLSLPLPGDLQVTAYARSAAAFSSIAHCRVTSDGRWGPIVLPLSSEEFKFKLRGEGIIPDSEVIDAPAPGAELWIEFDAQPGIPLTVLVQNEFEEPLRANVWGWWAYEGGGGDEEVETSSEGVAVLLGCPPTTVWVQATAPGYVALETFAVDLADGSPQTMTVQLERAGRIVGRVLHEGEPVESFKVQCWQGSTSDSITKFVSDSKDGGFEIDEAPLGEVLVVAVSDEFPRSEAYSVTVQSDVPAEVTIDLFRPVKGRGRVVDNATGVGIVEAKVQLYSNYRASYLASWGPNHSVDAEGRFDIEGFALGDTRFVVRAEGYADWLGQGVGVPGKVLELGVIPLARVQPLTLRLVSNSVEDYSNYEVLAQGNQWYPLLSFSPDGMVTYPDAGPGPTFINVQCPDGSARQFETQLYPGDDWTFEIPVGSGNTLNVRVQGADGRSPQQLGVNRVITASRLDSGISLRNVRDFSEGDTAEFTGLPDGEVLIEVQGAGKQRLATAMAKLETPATEIDVVIGGTGLRLRVVDVERRPLPGTTVRLFPATTGIDALIHVTTDAKGEYHFKSLVLDAVSISLGHPSVGSQTDIRIDLAGIDADETVELVLDPSAKLRLRIVDGSDPLGGIHTFLYNQTGVFLVGTFASDESGYVTSGPLEQGEYLVVIRQPGVWNVALPVRATPNEDETEIQVRRLGDLNVHVQTALGSPAHGVALELWSDEFGESVTEWIQNGRIPKPTDDLTTDSLGRISVKDLPHGTYRYTANPPGSAPVTGTVAISAKSAVNLTIQLP